jgi:hypothetical protein
MEFSLHSWRLAKYIKAKTAFNLVKAKFQNRSCKSSAHVVDDATKKVISIEVLLP